MLADLWGRDNVGDLGTDGRIALNGYSRTDCGMANVLPVIKLRVP
jgi:hypothetical protein